MASTPTVRYMTGAARVATGALALAVLFAPLPSFGRSGTDRTIRIEASQFAFRPGVIRAEPGDRLTLEVVSTDVVHGVYVEGYDRSATADPGQTARLTFVADRSGSFRIRCSVSCGPLHPFMTGTLRVGHNTLLWRAAGLAFLVLVVVKGARRS